MLRLRSLTLSRFRGVREGTIEGFADVNILLGRNNSGKSTVAEAIMRICFGRDGEDLLARKVYHIWEKARNAGHDSNPELWFNQDQSVPVVLRAEIEDSAHPEKKAYRTGVQLVGDRRNLDTAPLDAADRHLDLEGDNAHAISEAEATSFCRGINVFRPIDGTNKDIENKLWDQLLANRRDKVLTRVLNDVFQLKAEGFTLPPDGRLKVLFSDKGLPLDIQGDGTRAVLRCLMLLSLLKKTMFVIEEPECHQHPGSLNQFSLALCRSAKSQGVQLFVSTHSVECVRAFLKAAEEHQSESAFFHLKLEDGKLDARRLDAESAETLEHSGVDLRFLDLYA